MYEYTDTDDADEPVCPGCGRFCPPVTRCPACGYLASAGRYATGYESLLPAGAAQEEGMFLGTLLRRALDGLRRPG